MKYKPCKSCSTLVLMFILLLISVPVPSNGDANDQSKINVKSSTLPGNEENALNEARVKLEEAFTSYRLGDTEVTKQYLDAATKRLKIAAQTSQSEKVTEEAHNLAIEIDAFKEKLSTTSDQDGNSLVRFWHQTTSIIKRETDQLIHSYIELSNSEETLKHLLDAKLHLYNAEHDLFVSHDEEDAVQELDRVSNYLFKAAQNVNQEIKTKVNALSGDIQRLKEKVVLTNDVWKSGSIALALDDAFNNLTEADRIATPKFKLRIEMLKSDILELRNDVKRSDVKNEYDAAMVALKELIHTL